MPCNIVLERCGNRLEWPIAVQSDIRSIIAAFRKEDYSEGNLYRLQSNLEIALSKYTERRELSDPSVNRVWINNNRNYTEYVIGVKDSNGGTVYPFVFSQEKPSWLKISDKDKPDIVVRISYKQ